MNLKTGMMMKIQEKVKMVGMKSMIKISKKLLYKLEKKLEQIRKIIFIDKISRNC